MDKLFFIIVKNESQTPQAHPAEFFPSDQVIVRLAKCMGHLQDAERMIESIMPPDLFEKMHTRLEGTVQDVMLPWDSFHWLLSMNRDKFARHLGAREDMTSWWAAFKASEQGLKMWNLHPWLRFKEPRDLSRHVPLMMFDDAGVTGKSSSAFCRVYYSLTGKGSDLETRIVIAPSNKVDNADDQSWDIIMHSFEALAKPVPLDSWGGVLLFLGSDLEYVCNILGAKHYNANEMCAYCLANDSDLPHTNCTDAAEWRDTVLDSEEFKNRFRLPLHPLVAHEWWSLYTYRCDVMHMCDHHGVANHVAGNIAETHLANSSGPLPGANKELRLEFLNADMKAWQSMYGVRNRLPALKQDNICKGLQHYPDLRGPVVKAANSRSSIGYFRELQKRALEIDSSALNRHMFKVVDSLFSIYELCYSAGMFLEESQTTELDKHCHKLGVHYQWLAVNAVNSGQKRWQQVPKLHYLVGHIPTQAKLINPIFVQGYCNESMVGTLSKIFASSYNGPHHAVSGVTVMKKYLTAIYIDWWQAHV